MGELRCEMGDVRSSCAIMLHLPSPISLFPSHISLSITLCTVRNLLSLPHRAGIPNRLECLRRLYLVQYHFPDRPILGRKCIRIQCKCTSYVLFFNSLPYNITEKNRILFIELSFLSDKNKYLCHKIGITISY